MRVQGYIELDYRAMSDEEFEEFNAFLRQYMVHYKRVHKASREYYFCIMRDQAKIQDQEIDGIIVPGLMTLMAPRNPIINGLWQKDGVPFGKTKTVTYDPNTEEETIEITGEPEYPFDLDRHLVHTPTDKTYDIDGNLLSETTVNDFRPLHGFAGWTPGQKY